MMKRDKKRWYRKMAAGLGMTAALMGVMMGAPTACAAELSGEDTQAESGNTEAALSGKLEMSTNYPGITIKPGESVSFDLNFRNETGEGCDASLSIAELPEGWQGFFRGDGKHG